MAGTPLHTIIIINLNYIKKKQISIYVWFLMPVFLVLGSWRQEDQESRVSLDYMSFFIKKKKKSSHLSVL